MRRQRGASGQAIPRGKLVDLDLRRPKNASARANCAMRGPSRQITTRLVRRARSAPPQRRGRDRRRSGLRRHPRRPERQGTARNEKLGRRLRHQAAPRKSRMLRNKAVSNSAGVARAPITQASRSGSGTSIQPLELVHLRLAHGRDMRIGEAPGDQVHLAHAAMPGAEQQPPPALGVQPIARNCRSAHVRNGSQHEKPGRAGQRSYSDGWPRMSAGRRPLSPILLC